MSLPLPAQYSPHNWPYTPDEVLSWPDDNTAHEVIEGALYVSPHANVRHQMLLEKLRYALEPQLPPGWVTVGPVNLRLNETTLLVPDLAIVSSYDLNAVALSPADVQVAVEVVSPGSTRIDRLVKPGLYAEAGLAVWVFDDIRDPTGPTLRAYRSATPGGHREYAPPQGGTVHIGEPFPVTLDLAGLLR